MSSENAGGLKRFGPKHLFDISVSFSSLDRGRAMRIFRRLASFRIASSVRLSLSLRGPAWFHPLLLATFPYLLATATSMSLLPLPIGQVVSRLRSIVHAEDRALLGSNLSAVVDHQTIGLAFCGPALFLRLGASAGFSSDRWCIRR